MHTSVHLKTIKKRIHNFIMGKSPYERLSEIIADWIPQPSDENYREGILYEPLTRGARKRRR